MGSDYFSGNDPYGVFDKYVGLKWNTGVKLGVDVRYHFSSSYDIDVEEA